MAYQSSEYGAFKLCVPCCLGDLVIKNRCPNEIRNYFSNGKVKIEIALAKGKTLYDKRESDKARTMERQAKQSLRR